LDQVLDAWDGIQVSGVTIIESTGINRRARARQVGAPFMAGINRMMGSTMEGHYTLFTIVKGQQMVEACIRAAESVVGNLNEPDSGVLADLATDILSRVCRMTGKREERDPWYGYSSFSVQPLLSLQQ
jgi:hypothetical protein